MEKRTANNPDFPQMVKESQVVKESQMVKESQLDSKSPYVEVDFESLPYEPLSELDQQVEDILGFWSEFRELLKDYTKNLSTEQCEILIDYLTKDAHKASHGFRCTSFDEIADCIKVELDFRSIFDAYDQFKAVNGPVDVYCPTCKKQCQSQEEHDKNAAIFFGTQPKEHYRFDEMSRDELLILIKQMTPVAK